MKQAKDKKNWEEKYSSNTISSHVEIIKNAHRVQDGERSHDRDDHNPPS